LIAPAGTYNLGVFRLTREVRFAVNALPDEQLAARPTNSFGGFPSLTGAGQYFAIAVTLSGELHAQTSYLLNIKQVDETVRRQVIPALTELVRAGRFGGGANALLQIFDLLRNAFGGVHVDAATLALTPLLHLQVRSTEHPMVRLSQKFEFSASHRLHNPSLTDEENARVFGKCNHANGHGHNYEVQVTLRGGTNEHGLLIKVPNFEKIVGEFALRKLDHKNLNVDVPEFASLIPTVENIAMVVFRMLKNRFTGIGAELASVTVWETPKTWCEYAED